jgi:hypothetical protein
MKVLGLQERERDGDEKTTSIRIGDKPSNIYVSEASWLFISVLTEDRKKNQESHEAAVCLLLYAMIPNATLRLK